MAQENLQAYNEHFTKPVNRYGKTSHFLALAFSFIPPIWLWVYFGLFPGWNSILNGWLLCLATYALYAVIEPISYFPTLGLPGTYLSFLSGNISNMRLPASAIAQDVLHTERGSKKAELVSTLAISGSIILNLVIITIGALFGVALLEILPNIVLEAFAYVAPAIFGAMLFMFMAKNVVLGIVGVSLAVLMAVTPLPSWAQILVTIFGTIGFAIWWGHRKGHAKPH